MKYMKIIGVIIVIAFIFAINFLFRSKFKSGWCIKDNRDGYIWHVNNYSLGTYQIMGWQDSSWGNPVGMKKDILERSDINGIQVYNQTTCPEYSPK